MWAAAFQNASQQFVSCTHLSFAIVALHPTLTNKNLTELGPEIETALSQ
jgi:hypothetical protein